MLLKMAVSSQLSAISKGKTWLMLRMRDLALSGQHSAFSESKG
jgi:hypothetical protein